MNKETIKEIKKDLRTLKNKWIFKEYLFNNKVYETKRFNNWFQIFREKETKINIPFAHFETQKEVINNLLSYSKEV